MYGFSVSPKYELADLVTEHNEVLNNEVADRISVKLIKDNQTGWSAKIANGEAVITYKKADKWSQKSSSIIL